MSRKKKQRYVPAPKAPAPVEEGWSGFVTWERCEDCELREAVDISGKPRHDFDPHHRRLRKQGRLVNTTPRVVDDCENCGGTGRQRREVAVDPMQRDLP